MTRLVALVLTGALFVAALVAALVSHGHAIGLLVMATLLFGGVLFERWRYKAIETAAPGSGFQPSGERFVDPETGAPVEVWYNPTSGERRYVALSR